MSGDIGGIGGAGNVSKGINEALQQLGQTNQIVRDIFADLEEFKEATDRAIKQEALQRIRERLERLQSLAGNLGVSVTGSITSAVSEIQAGVDSARISGSAAPGDAQTLNQIQNLLDDLRQQLGM